MTAIHRLSHASTNDTVFRLVAAGGFEGVRILDVGAGEGYFSQLVGEHLKAPFPATRSTPPARYRIRPARSTRCVRWK
jgi:hypothetical protein